MNLDGTTRFISRSGKEKKQLVPVDLPLGTILVGEAAYGSQTAKKRRDAVGHDFIQIHDILQYKGSELHDQLGDVRQDALNKLYDASTTYEKYLPRLPRFTSNFVEEYINQPEGLILKPKLDQPYLLTGGKVPHWMKAKKCTTNDYVILGFELSTAETKKDREMCKYITVGGYVPTRNVHPSEHVYGVRKLQHPNNLMEESFSLISLLNVGSMHHDWCKNFAQKFDQYKDKVCEIGHFGLFDSGACRHPYFMKLRDDKFSTECMYRL
jgi:ATP-dependent DNA ligase